MTQDEQYEVAMAVVMQALTNTHTIVVGKITAVKAKTIDVLPSMARVVDGNVIQLPVFADVPPVFLHGGSSHLKMPLAVGDSCLLLISERCYDTWYMGQDGVRPLEARMHDYSDGFALVGIHPQSSALLIPKLIELIGDAFMHGNHQHDGDLLRNGNSIINGNVTINGNLTVTGTITAGEDVVTNGVSLKGHAHSGVQGGPSNTGGPV